MEEAMESPPPEYERIRSALASVEAPHGLRVRVEDERARTFTRRLVVRRMKLSGVLAGFAAVLGAAVALVAPNNGTPSFDQVVALAGKGPAAAAPAPSTAHPELLDARVGDVSFPTWSGEVPWRASGVRSDTVEGRRAVTVFYDDPRGARLGYTIVDGAALAWPKGATIVRRQGIEIHMLRSGAATVVTWREHGHSCVMSAPASVGRDRLVALAARVGRSYA
jgi:hypothetical protein